MLLRKSITAMALLAMGCAWSRHQQPATASLGPTVRNRPSFEALQPSLPGLAATPRFRTVGKSVEGRPIEAIRFGEGAARVLIIGSVHGDEPEGVHLAERFVQYLQREPQAIAGYTVIVVKDANPDGSAARRRTNARGVDLNRNFPARNWQRGKATSGARPASEPETQALVRVLDEFRPHRIVAIHSTRGEAMVNFDGPAQGLAAAMARHNGYQVSDYIGYPTPGSLGSLLGRDGRLPIITLELPRGVAANAAWQANREALVEAVRHAGPTRRSPRRTDDLLPATRPAA